MSTDPTQLQQLLALAHYDFAVSPMRCSLSSCEPPLLSRSLRSSKLSNGVTS